jgi:hypothetical protein
MPVFWQESEFVRKVNPEVHPFAKLGESELAPGLRDVDARVGKSREAEVSDMRVLDQSITV